MRGKNLDGKVGYAKDWAGLRDKYLTTGGFLRYAVEEYARFNGEYQRATGDFPLCYGEMQNQPIWWYSMRCVSKFRTLVFAEQPWERKLRGNVVVPEKHRSDYRVLLKDGDVETVLWIEYKHRIGYLNRKEHQGQAEDRSVIGLKKIAEEWADDKRKLDRMDPDKLSDLWSFSGSSRRPVKVNLLIMPICQRAKRKDDPLLQGASREVLRSWIGKVRESLNRQTPTNWEAVWALHPSLQKPIDWKDEEGKTWWDKYPGVFFFAYLE